MRTVIDMTGQRIGRLVVLSFVASKNGAIWRVRCDCGTEKNMSRANLTRGEIVSCGCARREAKTHGHSRGKSNGGFSPTYRSWAMMVNRCTNPNAPRYKDWGGRGISICERWRSFEGFLADMGERPAGTSIDRINNDGNYEPGNCRWATPKEQNNNKRHPCHQKTN